MDRERTLITLRERIVAFAASRMGRDAAEDVAQETLVLIEEKYAHVTAVADLVPLALQIARFKITAVRRKAHRRGEDTAISVDDVPLRDTAADPGTLIDRNRRIERLSAAINTLGDRCRELIRMKIAGHSFAEIRAHFQIDSINTIYTWDFRCRKELLAKLGGSWEDRS